jgi:hypothetical protein
VQQTGPASEGLLRDWPEASSGVDKNYGYAFQWFRTVASLIAILYVWFQVVLAYPAEASGCDQAAGADRALHADTGRRVLAAATPQRTRIGRWKMLAVLALCAPHR